MAGINLVPQYFRSERQLIIDTEKNSSPTARRCPTRNSAPAPTTDLGADQALLRLRYGQFLGEDQEDGAAADHAETNLNPLRASAHVHPPGPRGRRQHRGSFPARTRPRRDSEGGSDENREASPTSRAHDPAEC